MKILIVNAYDIQGGASRAAYRLHKALLCSGVESNMLVQNKISNDPSVIGPATTIQKIIGKLRPKLDTIPVRILYSNYSSILFSPSWLGFSNIVNKINKISPDVVHLHWICGGMMTIDDIARIEAPIVWSLHDMWAFTGGFHYENTEEFHKDSKNRSLTGTKKIDNLSKKLLKRKKAVFAKKNDITIVGLSRWIAKEAKKSKMFGNKNIINLPNPINIDLFSPMNKFEARKLLNLPNEKKLILFGAMSATKDRRKGWLELKSALNKVSSNNAELVVFGSDNDNYEYPLAVQFTGTIKDDKTLKILYSACDVMVVPSLQENLANTIMEALSCGLPVVGFNIGGNSDMIAHKSNGYLATPFSSDDLSYGIDWVIENTKNNKLSQNARSKVVNTYESELVASKYINLYQSLL